MLTHSQKKSALRKVVKANGRLLLVGLLAFIGCGYSFQGGGSILPEDVRRVYIPRAENSTTELGLADLVTEAMRERFERFGVLTIVDGLNEADAVLNTRIVSLKKDTDTVTANTESALQQQAVLTLDMQLRRITGGLLWRGDNIRVQRTFASTGDVVVTSAPGFAAGGLSQADLGSLDDREVSRGQEQQVLELLAEDAARQVYAEAVAPEF